MSKKEFNSYGIILLLTGFTMRFLTVGIFRCFGIILRELNDLHDLGQGELNWIPSVNTGCMFLLGPIAGILQHKVGCRLTILIGSVLASVGLVSSMFVPNLHLLYITYGVFTGTGFCLVSLSSNIPINTYFHEKRIMAHSLAGLGAGIGLSSMPFLMTVLLETYGWRGTFAILSGLYLQCAVCGMLIGSRKRDIRGKELLEKHKTDAKDKNHNTDAKDKKHKTDAKDKTSSMNDTKKILKDKYFIMYGFSAFIVKHVYHVPHLIMPIMMSSYGISPTIQASVFTASGVCSMVQRLGTGCFMDKLKAYVMAIMGLSIILVGAATICLAFVKHYILFIAYGALFGILSGVYANLQPTTLLDIVGRTRYGLGLGYFRFFVGLGVATGPPIAGWLIDNRGKYDWVFYYAGMFFISGGTLMILIYLFKRRVLNIKQNVNSKTTEVMIQVEEIKETRNL